MTSYEIREIDLSLGHTIQEETVQKTEPQFALCVRNGEYSVSLERHKIYRVLPDEDAIQENELRVIDESGEDYLFPASYFMLLSLPPAIQQALLVAP